MVYKNDPAKRSNLGGEYWWKIKGGFLNESTKFEGFKEKPFKLYKLYYKKAAASFVCICL